MLSVPKNEHRLDGDEKNELQIWSRLGGEKPQGNEQVAPVTPQLAWHPLARFSPDCLLLLHHAEGLAEDSLAPLDLSVIFLVDEESSRHYNQALDVLARIIVAPVNVHNIRRKTTKKKRALWRVLKQPCRRTYVRALFFSDATAFALLLVTFFFRSFDISPVQR